MARTTRRYLLNRVNASLLAAALALPAGVTSAVAAQQAPDAGRTEAPVQTPPPPPEPPPPPPPTPEPEPPPPEPPPPEPPPKPPPPPDDPPPKPPPPKPPPPDDPPPADEDEDQQDQGEGEDKETKTKDPPSEQTQAVEEVTTTLSARRDDVPKELTASVDAVTATLRAAETPDTTPQDRGAVTDSAKELASALEVISDDSTPAKVRKQLTVLVKQVPETLEAGQAPDVPPEDRSRLFLVVKRTTGMFGLVADPQTPQSVAGPTMEAIRDTNKAEEQDKGNDETGVTISSSMDLISDRQIPEKQRQRLAEITAEVSRLMKRATDPKASPEERAEARQEMNDRTSRMKDEQEEAASAQEPPDSPLGEAAEVCTNAVFEAVSQQDLSKGLEDVTPPDWDSTGVKDFWKASDEGNDVLDVRAQLENDQHAHAPFEVAPLITGLAEIVEGRDLIGKLGGKPSAHCRQTAVYLREEGVTVGSWLPSDEG
ncbi:hypothetical protein [Streptomyces sp. NPDC093568]|uniref:hypothetical protein n=1 Tax=Streptomyces sp. NPDC093568 TaxID=3366041 RepID=UPI0037FD38DD